MPLFETSDDSEIPRYYKSGTQKINVWQYDTSAAVSSGTVTFYLTKDGTSEGDPVFNTLYTESINIQIFDPENLYTWSSPAVSEDKKTLTLTINKQVFSSGNALLNLVGGLISVLTGVLFTAAPDGTTVYLQVKGD